MLQAFLMHIDLTPAQVCRTRLRVEAMQRDLRVAGRADTAGFGGEPAPVCPSEPQFRKVSTGTYCLAHGPAVELGRI
jgi:hypothetical protein